MVERNPLGLPPRILAEFTPWKDRITGPQLLLGYDRRGRALFSVGESRVAVMGVMQDIEEVVPEEGSGRASDGRLCHAAAVCRTGRL